MAAVWFQRSETHGDPPQRWPVDGSQATELSMHAQAGGPLHNHHSAEILWTIRQYRSFFMHVFIAKLFAAG